jgi:transposase
MRYVGLDLHIADCTLAVIEHDGTVLFEATVDTSAQNLIAVLDAVAEPKAVVLEEGTLAAWAWRTLTPHASRVVVADPVRNAWIGRDERNDDLSSAHKLAELLRGGFVHPVHHTCQSRQLFKEIVMAYHDTVSEITRFKCKLKSKLRQHAVHCTSAQVYHPQQRELWLARLDDPGAQLQARLLLDSVDRLSDHKQQLSREIDRRARDFEPIARFRELPGIGLIRAATFVAIVDTPHRFADKRKLWSYCGLAVVSRSSSAMAGPEHLNRRFNRPLKALAKSAAVDAIKLGDNRFARQYHRLVAGGTSTDNARLTVARAIVSTLYAMWRSGEHYRPADGEA